MRTPAFLALLALLAPLAAPLASAAPDPDSPCRRICEHLPPLGPIVIRIIISPLPPICITIDPGDPGSPACSVIACLPREVPPRIRCLPPDL